MKDISAPTLLVDERKCRRNIRMMADRAKEHGLGFRPHFKTHQSSDIAGWIREEGVTAATVSSVRMAGYFIENGWRDITIAFPANIRQAGDYNRLAGKADELRLLINESTPLEVLNGRLKERVKVAIEIDTGSRRTGVAAGDTETLDSLWRHLQNLEHLEFDGFYSHPGHSYSCSSEEEIREVHDKVLQQLSGLQKRYGAGSDRLPICIGDTPCCSVAAQFDPATSISPGNFVFYDLVQAGIGSCTVDEIAVALACPVVAMYPERNEVILHAGAVHLSKDTLEDGGKIHYGKPVWLEEHGWSAPLEGCHMRALSQEHGVLYCSREVMRHIEVGQLLGVLPVHSCLTANLMGGYRNLEGRKINHMHKQIL